LENECLGILFAKMMNEQRNLDKKIKKYNNFNLENNDERAKAIHLRRQAFAFLRNEEAVAKVFKEIAPKYMDRNGGYTRIIKTDVRRGDSAELAIIELV